MVILFMLLMPFTPNATASMTWIDIYGVQQQAIVPAFTDGSGVGINYAGDSNLTTSLTVNIDVGNMISGTPDCTITFNPVTSTPAPGPDRAPTTFDIAPTDPVLIDFRDPNNAPTVTELADPTLPVVIDFRNPFDPIDTGDPAGYWTNWRWYLDPLDTVAASGPGLLDMIWSAFGCPTTLAGPGM